MRVLYVAMAHDYGDPARGPSFDELNFRSSLEGMGHEVIPFDFMAREAAVGREAMNAELIAAAADARPDLAFCVLYGDEIAPDTIRAVRREGRAPTMNWFPDDHRRFDDFSRHYAPAFDWSVTTDHAAVPRYEAIGYRGAILSQWAFNQFAYTNASSELRHDVTFVGQPYGERRASLDALSSRGHRVEAWGHGWSNGRLTHDEMVDVFSSSRINLNFAHSYQPPPFRTLSLRGKLSRLVRGTPSFPETVQIKARTFEVPGTGGFLLTQRAPDLEHYFDVGREIAVFDGRDELIQQVEHWLSNPEERAQVAEAGRRRVLAEHTYDRRFTDIFRTAGLA
jgi:spore maturation protein CgeB